MNDAVFQLAFDEQERRDRISNSKLAITLSMILMPAGVALDYFVYHRDKGLDFILLFLAVRVAASILMGLVWLWFRFTGEKHDRVFGVMWYAIPTFSIVWMIYYAGDSTSPYYAGLNIVLLAVGLLSPWTYVQNMFSAVGVIALYLVASTFMPVKQTAVFNNLYFLILTSVIVVVGSRAAFRQRFREFQLRWQLDENRRQLEETNQKLTELDQAKSRFFANISHELRTPLTLLISPLENLMVRFGRSVDDETRGTFQTMHANGMRLLKLINDLLDLVRLESGRLEVKHAPLEVAEFIKGLASAARQVANDKKIQLVTFADPALGTIQADRDKLEKIVLNLVFNALKFTPGGGRVEMRAEKQGEEFLLVVADTGMGIAEKNLPHVFDRFWQADDSSKRKYQGVGIGLSLVKELAEIQNGDVTVQSQEGKGTTFTVRLPYQKADPEQTQMPVAGDDVQLETTVTSEEWLANLYRRAELFPAMTPLQDTLKPVESLINSNRPKLLVADDEPDMLRFLKSQLSRHYQVIEAVDGQQAVDKASQFLPDIILLDMMMPEKDGMQACREIRERTSTHSIPIILLTARADEETKLAALQAGASDFLAKPFSTTELHVRIKNLVESHEYQRKVSKQKDALETTLEQLKETESQLVQSEKLASLGRMSAGIIHEINNPLNFATTGLFTLRKKGKYLTPEHQQEYAEILKDVEEGIVRVKNIVSDLRMFTHPDTVSLDQVELSEAITSALRFLSNEWKDKVRIEQKLPENQTVQANKNKLIHVFVNLLQNSLDALRGKSFDGEQPTIWIEGRVENGASIVAVRDNGHGIESQHLDKIFDPFFTTKNVGEGMGLGLSICYRIIQESAGKISVRTEPGKFCEFTLEFPVKQ